MRAAIIDDFPQCREKIRDCLCRYFRENYIGEMPAIDEFAGGEEFLSGFTKEAYDIIFIDQYMNGLSGMDTALRIRKKDMLAVLVFVTASREHAVDSYGVRASGYLVKPYGYEDFKRTVELAGLEKIRNARFICIEDIKILLNEILWCDKDGHYIQIHTDRRGVLRFRISFGELSGLLGQYQQFLSCYKGCIVNMERAEYIEKLDFVMDTGDKIPFSKRDRKKIEMLYQTYLFQREREDALL